MKFTGAVSSTKQCLGEIRSRSGAIVNFDLFMHLTNRSAQAASGPRMECASRVVRGNESWE